MEFIGDCDSYGVGGVGRVVRNEYVECGVCMSLFISLAPEKMNHVFPTSISQLQVYLSTYIFYDRTKKSWGKEGRLP
jgi:hypothetical protein